MQSAAPLLIAAALQGAPSWTEDVRPILAEHCFECHGPDEAARRSGLRLDTEEGLIGTDGGPGAIDRAAPHLSELLHRVTTSDEFERMPPPEAGSTLSAEDLETLRRWLEAGGLWEPHWAYGALRSVTPPALAGVGDLAPIDRFIAARLRAEGFGFAAPAEPRELLRRLHLDLTGLPPSGEDVARFLDDPSEEAYAAEVDRLLASMAHAEHWARYWLEAARYADSHGYTIDGGRSIWPWRDWVIRSIHGDQPFSAFTVEQLAGDLLPGATREQRIATGFHRNTQINQEGGAKDEENRINAVIDRVATTGTVWLGATLGCAQCHTHKFDPITQTEYFGLFAYLNSTADGGVTDAPRLLVPRDELEREAVATFEAEEARLITELSLRRAAAQGPFRTWQPSSARGSNGPELRLEEDGGYRVLGQNAVYSTYTLQGLVPPTGARHLRIEALPQGGPGRGRKRTFLLQEVRLLVRVATETDAEWRTIGMDSARASRGGDPVGPDTPRPDPRGVAMPGVIDDDPETGWSLPEDWSEPEVLILTLEEGLEAGSELKLELVQEAGANRTLGSFRLGLAATFDPETPLVPEEWREASQALDFHRRLRPNVPTTLVLEERTIPRMTRRFERGSFMEPRELVAPHVPAALDRSGQEPPQDRLAFARWIVGPENALMRRVTVNRWWSHLFGRGLVETVDDFGVRGARPSHPELLEWLAGEMLASGDSRRHILRQMVLSRTYRQGRSVDPALRDQDPDNVLVGRRELRRLSGEAIRDAMLVASGRLVARPFGPPVEPPQPPGVFAFTQTKKSWRSPAGEGRYRRSLYTRIWRSSPYPFFGTFDAPGRDASCVRRTTSRTPLQALALVNDPQVMELARELVARLDREVGPDGDVPDGERIVAAFGWALQRSPSNQELDLLVDFIRSVRDRDGKRAAWVGFARALFNMGEFTHAP
ncbi:MAG: PSD1 and planctomycete cytochrome C domain-containing protein [Planctomycetota bacterium]|nr:PSD1 and planctomycete cytochrome C domain-containing protein [Planctomycetota bacterium]